MAWPEKPIALDPKRGGRSISPAAPGSADIIVSTTGALVSGAIRLGTGSRVSHAMLHVGGGEVVEAIGRGVVRRPLRDALGESALAVAYRAPDVEPATARRITAFALSQVGAAYGAGAAAWSAVPTVLCKLRAAEPAIFFCSQFVFEAYRRGGRPSTSDPSHRVTPETVVSIAQRHLAYVGHLTGQASWFPVLAP